MGVAGCTLAVGRVPDCGVMQMQSRFRSDRRLTVRMTVTMFLLGLLYVAFFAALIVLLKSWLLVVALMAAMFVAQFWFSDRIAMFAMRGRVVEREEYPELHAVVDRLCAIADMPKPVVAVSEMDMPNAFATGRNPDHAVICVTTGLLRRLEPAELEGVLAHELSHVAHKDVAVITDRVVPRCDRRADRAVRLLLAVVRRRAPGPEHRRASSPP